jgi:hypothetical protein
MKIEICVDEKWPVFTIKTATESNLNEIYDTRTLREKHGIDIPDENLDYYRYVQDEYEYMQSTLKELYERTHKNISSS